jgi:hypothetical protein
MLLVATILPHGETDKEKVSLLSREPEEEFFGSPGFSGTPTQSQAIIRTYGRRFSACQIRHAVG